MSSAGPKVVAVLPASSAGCSGVLVDGPGRLLGRINATCLGCLRYQSRLHTSRHLTPNPTPAGHGRIHCGLRIRA